MRSLLLFFACCLLTTSVFAQDKDYADRAAKLQKEIWGTPAAEFKSTTVPANLSNESAVVLARSYNAQWTSSGKFKFMIVAVGVALHTQKIITFHERVKINDKVALEGFSKIEYQKKLDNTTSIFFTAKLRNTKNTFVGVKIIKPSGKEVIVNTSEEVLVKNETKDQKGKLAIPDLQVGDVIDYYITSVDVSESAEGTSFKDNENVFLLADEYPVLYYSIDFQFDKKVKTKYIYANGAPHFDEKNNDDGDLLLSLKLHNIPKFQSHLWTSALRQYPYIEIGSAYVTNMNLYDKRLSKENSMFEGNEEVFGESFQEYPNFDDSEKATKDYFGGRKNTKNAPLDSVMKMMYDQWKFRVFCAYDGDELESIRDLNYRNANSRGAAITMGMMLTDMDVDYDVLLVASRKTNTLENSYSLKDFDALIRINGGMKPMYMCFDDPMTHFNEIPERFQGEKVVVMSPKRHNARKYTFDYSNDVLPVIPSVNNKLDEQLVVTMLPDNMQKLKIERTVKETGSLRHDDQKQLIPVQDVDNGMMELTKGETLAKRLSRSKATKKKLDDFNAAFEKEHAEINKNFTNEIKARFDQEPQQLTNFKIIKPALESDKPVFEYSATFMLDNLVKKAGSNYIVDAGKLSGGFIKLDDKERKRTIDVYMPCARTFNYVVVINIPPGYAAKGMEEMNQSKTNKTGSFTSSAVVKGNKLTITATRTYKNNFEKAADWPLLVDLLDLAANFDSKKILLEKQN
ncbi:MAG: hypothetical protein ACXVJG_08880 [Mucilaginibacter sp.]